MNTRATEQLADGRRLIPLRTFWQGMLGLSKMWFYKHVDDPDFPQRVYIGTKPRLVLDECEAYVERHLAAREQRLPAPPKKRTPPARRKRGSKGKARRQRQQAVL